MDLSAINPALVGAPLLGGGGFFLYRSWRREMTIRYNKALERQLAYRKEVLLGSSALRNPTEVWQRTTGSGQIPILAVGSYGAGLLPFILQEFEAAGAADFVSTIYLLELDEMRAQICKQSIAATFRSRVIVAHCPDYIVGMSGDTIAAVQEDSPLWGQDVLTGAREWLSRIERHTSPGLLLTLVSPGGSAALGWPVVQAFAERYPKKPIYLVTILDEKTVVRERFPHLRQLYTQRDLTRGFIVSDNRRFKRRSDTGIGVLFGAAAGASWIADQPLDPWNALAYIFPADDPGRAATISVWAETLPVYYLPLWERSLPEVFFTKASLVEEKAIRGITTLLDHPELQGLALEAAGLGSTRFCCVAAPVVPKPDFQLSARRIDQALEGLRSTDPDLSIQYASVGARLTPDTQETPMVVVLLQGLRDGPEAVDALALGAPVDPKFLPMPTATPVARLPQRLPLDVEDR